MLTKKALMVSGTAHFLNTFGMCSNILPQLC